MIEIFIRHYCLACSKKQNQAFQAILWRRDTGDPVAELPVRLSYQQAMKEAAEYLRTHREEDILAQSPGAIGESTIRGLESGSRRSVTIAQSTESSLRADDPRSKSS